MACQSCSDFWKSAQKVSNLIMLLCSFTLGTLFAHPLGYYAFQQPLLNAPLGVHLLWVGLVGAAALGGFIISGVLLSQCPATRILFVTMLGGMIGSSVLGFAADLYTRFWVGSVFLGASVGAGLVAMLTFFARQVPLGARTGTLLMVAVISVPVPALVLLGLFYLRPQGDVSGYVVALCALGMIVVFLIHEQRWPSEIQPNTRAPILPVLACASLCAASLFTLSSYAVWAADATPPDGYTPTFVVAIVFSCQIGVCILLSIVFFCTRVLSDRVLVAVLAAGVVVGAVVQAIDNPDKVHGLIQYALANGVICACSLYLVATGTALISKMLTGPWLALKYAALLILYSCTMVSGIVYALYGLGKCPPAGSVLPYVPLLVVVAFVIVIAPLWTRLVPQFSSPWTMQYEWVPFAQRVRRIRAWFDVTTLIHSPGYVPETLPTDIVLDSATDLRTPGSWGLASTTTTPLLSKASYALTSPQSKAQEQLDTLD